MNTSIKSVAAVGMSLFVVGSLVVEIAHSAPPSEDLSNPRLAQNSGGPAIALPEPGQVPDSQPGRVDRGRRLTPQVDRSRPEPQPIERFAPGDVGAPRVDEPYWHFGYRPFVEHGYYVDRPMRRSRGWEVHVGGVGPWFGGVHVLRRRGRVFVDYGYGAVDVGRRRAYGAIVGPPVGAELGDVPGIVGQPRRSSAVGNRYFVAAQISFRAGDYEGALRRVSHATIDYPDDSEVNQVHSLVLFALGRYEESAGFARAALNGGPGWDWSTLRGMYASGAIYTEQLRPLEAATKDHPDDVAPKFLLAYHYLMMSHVESARRHIERVVELDPKDKLAAWLLKMIDGKTTEPPEGARGPRIQPEVITPPAPGPRPGSGIELGPSSDTPPEDKTPSGVPNTPPSPGELSEEKPVPQRKTPPALPKLPPLPGGP